MSKRPTVDASGQTGQKRTRLQTNRSAPACLTQPQSESETDELSSDEEEENVEILADVTSKENQSSSTGSIEVPSRDWQIGHTLNECLMDVYDNKRWTDMVIRCGKNGDSRPLKAHKVILAARSPVFEAMLFGPCSEPKEEYIFPDADVEIFDMMLRYLYQDCIEDSLKNVEEAMNLSEMAHMYQLPRLVDQCEHYIRDNISFTNACQIMDFALKYELSALCKVCVDFIDKNAPRVLKTPEFLSVSQKGLSYIMKGDTLFADEDLIFTRCVKWAEEQLSINGEEVDGKKVREVLGEAFLKSRLPTVDVVTLLGCIKRKGYFSKEEYEDIMEYKFGHIHTLSFMTTLSRLPLEESVKVSCRGLPKTSSKLEQTLNIEIDKDVFLESISMTRFPVFIKVSDDKLFALKDRKYVSVRNIGRLPKGIECELHAIVSIDAYNFNEHLDLWQGRTASFGILPSPILLRRQDSPIKLKVEIETTWSDEVNGFKKMLCSFHGKIETSRSTSSNITVTASPENASESMLLVNELVFRNLSSR